MMGAEISNDTAVGYKFNELLLKKT